MIIPMLSSLETLDLFFTYNYTV